MPRPIGWLSSIRTDGVENLAPYGQWQNLTFHPPMVMFSANQYADGRRKDTVLNAEQTGWFVWNMATWDLREAVNISAMALPPQESEFDRAGITVKYADMAKVPMVAASPVHFECRYLPTQRLAGNSPVGTIDVVFAKVERIHIDESVFTADGKLDVPRIKPIARMGYYDYTVVTDTFEMRIPDANETKPLAWKALPAEQYRTRLRCSPKLLTPNSWATSSVDMAAAGQCHKSHQSVRAAGQEWSDLRRTLALRASCPLVTSWSRSASTRATTGSGAAVGDVCGRRDRGWKAASPSRRYRASSSYSHARETS